MLASIGIASAPWQAFAYLDSAAASERRGHHLPDPPVRRNSGSSRAGVIHFIDRALTTFDQDKRQAGLAAIQAKRKELFPRS